MFQTALLRKKKHTFHVQEPFSESMAFYEIMWESILQPDGHR